MSASSPTLLGLEGRSSKDFSAEASWGKNQFNNAFPASLACYMHREKLDPIYLALNDSLRIEPDKTIPVRKLFGADPDSPDLYFDFESQYEPYHPLAAGTLPRADLVIKETSGSTSLRGLEIKLTTLPDSDTAHRPDDEQSCEIVIRPDTIVYAALSTAKVYEGRASDLRGRLDLDNQGTIQWADPAKVKPLLPAFAAALDRVLSGETDKQSPLLLQPVWKTVGKRAELHEDCFDIFVWSDFAINKLIKDRAETTTRRQMTRAERSLVWLIKMLHDFSVDGRINLAIRSEIGYTSQTDKAFSIKGPGTHKYLKGSKPEKSRLTHPRVKRSALKEIILGEGEKYLSPERRLDGVVQSTFDGL